MLADIHLSLTAVFCTADDLLREKGKKARRSVTDAEVVTLAAAQEMMGICHRRGSSMQAGTNPRSPALNYGWRAA